MGRLGMRLISTVLRIGMACKTDKTVINPVRKCKEEIYKYLD